MLFDTAKMGSATDAAKNATSGATAGVTGQNVYLYCASAGLATVFRESVPEIAGENPKASTRTDYPVCANSRLSKRLRRDYRFFFSRRSNERWMGHASGSKLSAKIRFDSGGDQRPSRGEAIRDVQMTLLHGITDAPT